MEVAHQIKPATYISAIGSLCNPTEKNPCSVAGEAAQTRHSCSATIHTGGTVLCSIVLCTLERFPNDLLTDIQGYMPFHH